MATKRTSKTIHDAGEIVQEVKEDTSVVEIQSTDDTCTNDEGMDISTKRESMIWKCIDFADDKTYVMNVPTGCVIRTESPNGSTMCFIQNVKYEDGFRRTT